MKSKILGVIIFLIFSLIYSKNVSANTFDLFISTHSNNQPIQKTHYAKELKMKSMEIKYTLYQRYAPNVNNDQKSIKDLLSALNKVYMHPLTETLRVRTPKSKINSNYYIEYNNYSEIVQSHTKNYSKSINFNYPLKECIHYYTYSNYIYSLNKEYIQIYKFINSKTIMDTNSKAISYLKNLSYTDFSLLKTNSEHILFYI